MYMLVNLSVQVYTTIRKPHGQREQEETSSDHEVQYWAVIFCSGPTNICLEGVLKKKKCSI